MGEARTQLTGFYSLRRRFLHFPLTFSHTPKIIFVIIKETLFNAMEYILIHRQSHFQNNPCDGQYEASYEKPVPSVRWQWHVLKRDTIFSALRIIVIDSFTLYWIGACQHVSSQTLQDIWWIISYHLEMEHFENLLRFQFWKVWKYFDSLKFWRLHVFLAK